MESDKALAVKDFDDTQIDLIKKQIMPGANNDELAMFAMVCKRTGLDPFARQIYAIKRQKKINGQNVSFYSPEASIDGLRATADKTGAYAGSDDPSFELDDKGYPLKATITIYKLVGGVRCAFTASARWDEYCPKEENKAFMWNKMPHVMLGKVAEALALRKGFPQQMSGLYTGDEMAQADSTHTVINKPIFPEPAPKAWKDQKGGVLIEETALSTPRGEHPVDKIGSLSEDHKPVYLDIVDALINLCGTSGQMMEDVLEMASELRTPDLSAVSKPGARKPLELKYTKDKGGKSSQAAYALNRLKEYKKETIKNAVEVWRGMR